MENINYIYGETTQGELITFDGFSPMQSMKTKKKELLWTSFSNPAAMSPCTP